MIRLLLIPAVIALAAASSAPEPEPEPEVESSPLPVSMQKHGVIGHVAHDGTMPLLDEDLLQALRRALGRAQ